MRVARIHLFRTSHCTLGYQGGEDQQTEPGQVRETARSTDAQTTSQLASGFYLNRWGIELHPAGREHRERLLALRRLSCLAHDGLSPYEAAAPYAQAESHRLAGWRRQSAPLKREQGRNVHASKELLETVCRYRQIPG